MTKSDYQTGLEDGFTDLMIVSQPINEDRHTYDNYLGIGLKYQDAIFNLTPTDYQRGYGDGGDLAALYLGPCRVNGHHCKGCYHCEERDN